MITSLLLDLDDTLLSFKADEHKALTKTLTHFGIEPTDEVMTLYSQITSASGRHSKEESWSARRFW